MATRKKAANGRRRRNPRAGMTLAEFRARLAERHAELVVRAQKIEAMIRAIDAERV